MHERTHTYASDERTGGRDDLHRHTARTRVCLLAAPTSTRSTSSSTPRRRKFPQALPHGARRAAESAPCVDYACYRVSPAYYYYGNAHVHICTHRMSATMHVIALCNKEIKTHRDTWVTSPCESECVCVCVCATTYLRRFDDAHYLDLLPSRVALLSKLDNTIFSCIDGVVISEADIFAWMELGSALTHDDVPTIHTHARARKQTRPFTSAIDTHTHTHTEK